MSRIPLVDTDDVPESKRHLLQSMATTNDIAEEYRHLLSGDERNVYRVVGHVLPALESFRDYAGTVRDELALAERQCELVILTAANELGSRYEWHQHVRIGLNEGLTVEEIRAIESDDVDGFSPPDETLVRYVRDFVRGDVTDDRHQQAREYFEEDTLVGIGLLVGVYLTIARLLDATAVETEEPFVGWDLSGLRE